MKLAESDLRTPAPAMSTIDLPVKPEIIAIRVFRMEDQTQFAEFSGDFNPIHMSLLASRRTQAGAPVVHGINQVLWSLESLGQILQFDRHIVHVRARFSNFLLVDEEARLVLIELTENVVRLTIAAHNIICTNLTITMGSGDLSYDSPASGPPFIFAETLGVCRNLSFDEAATSTGNLAIRFETSEAAFLFPRAAALIGTEQVLAVAALSRLVGMECPGLHSLFAAMDISFAQADTTTLQHSVSFADRRFSLIRQAVKGGGINGTIETYLRTPPISQPHATEIQRLVTPSEFTHSTALVVGASRGLGEFTAKAIGSGGGRVIATYHIGRDEGEKVAQEIRSCGGLCDLMSLDVRRPIAPQLKSMPAMPTSIYYFATAKIFGRKCDLFDAERFSDFTHIYLNGFFNLCSYLRSLGLQKVTMFYPSSVAVESRPVDMGMYAMAKVAGELLCEEISRSWPEFKVTVFRLPRLITDQTASVMNVASPPMEDVLLPIIRRVEKGFSGN